MRIPILLSLSIALVIAGCSTSSKSTDGQSRSGRQERLAADLDKIAALAEGGNFSYTLRSANPTGGRSIQITSEYTLKAVQGEYEAYLPYFGRAQQASYGGDGGIEFKGKPENLQISRNDKKNTLSLAFAIKGENDQYTINLEIGASGYGTLLVSPQRRQSISYYGLFTELKL